MSNKNSKHTSAETSGSFPGRDEVAQDTLARIDSAVRLAFKLRRDSFVGEVMNRIGNSAGSIVPVASEEAGRDWTGVESLSRLRSLVGGRFENLKKKWVDAGLPLREHRGDKPADFKIDEAGWLDLSNWVLKQGFESRLAKEGSQFIFELRPVSK